MIAEGIYCEFFTFSVGCNHCCCSVIYLCEFTSHRQQPSQKDNLRQTDVGEQTAGGREDPGAGDEEALGEPTKSHRNSGGTVPTAARSEQCRGREEWPSLPPEEKIE